jgi:hypothetical protein
MPTSKREDDEMKDCADITEDILVEGGKGETITIIVRGWNSVWRYNKTMLDLTKPEGEIRQVKFSSNFVKELDLSSTTHCLESLIEDCALGMHQDVEIDIRLHTCAA